MGVQEACFRKLPTVKKKKKMLRSGENIGKQIVFDLQTKANKHDAEISVFVVSSSLSECWVFEILQF